MEINCWRPDGSGRGKYSLLLKDEGEGWACKAAVTRRVWPAPRWTFCREPAREHPIIYQRMGGHRCVPSCPHAALQDDAEWPSTTSLLASLLLGLSCVGSEGLVAIRGTQATASRAGRVETPFFCFYSLLLPFQDLAYVFLNVLGF